MDTESFTAANLGHLDFESESQKVDHIPLPNSIPIAKDYTQLPKEILKSSTVENLISQNEDLMARLKVSLRRLSILEVENKKLSEEVSKAQTPQTSITIENLISQNEDLMARLKVSMRRLSLLENENQKLLEELNKIRQSENARTDQFLLLKEKDKVWKQKYDDLETKYKVQFESLMAFQKKLQAASSEIARHTKYHERIKNQVKPYISQLKEFSKAQEVKLKELDRSLSSKDAQIRDLRHQIIEVTKNSRFQVETTEKKTHEMVQFYEDQLISLKTEVANLKKVQEELELKSTRLNSALERQDSLENEVVTLRRSKEDLKDRLNCELEKQRDRINELVKQNQKLGVEHADLQIRVVEDQSKVSQLEKENFQLKEQMESLRFMWAQKNDEHEKLKSAATALERLNMELSQRLNEARSREGV